MTDSMATDPEAIAMGGLLILQPALEPAPSGVVRLGRFAAFFFVRWSSWCFGIELLFAGAAIQIGPLMFGVSHIQREINAADRFRALRRKGGDHG